LLASVCLYFFNPLSPDASSFPYLLPQNSHQFANPTGIHTAQPTAETVTYVATPSLIPISMSAPLKPASSTDSIKFDNDQPPNCQQVIDPEDDDKEFFPGYNPDAPGNANLWVNNPREENYFTQLSKTQKALLDNTLPPNQIFDGDMNDIGDGYGGGKGVKLRGRKEKFDQFYRLGTQEDWRKWFAELDAEVNPYTFQIADLIH